MKYIGLFYVDDYADCGGGMQDPIVLDAKTMDDAKKEAQAFVIARGRGGIKNADKHIINHFCIYEVSNEFEVDIKELNFALMLQIEDKKKRAEKRTEVEKMLKLMQKYPKEAKQIVIDNDAEE